MRGFAYLAAGLAGVLASTASIAYQSDQRKNKQERNYKQSRSYMHQYAACVVKRSHDRAAEAIMANVSNDKILRDYPDLISSQCLGQVALGVNMRFGGDLYRYALAGALVNADCAADGPLTFADRLPLAHLTMTMTAEERDARASKMKGKKKAEFLELYDNNLMVAWLSRYGECIVRADPKNTRLWLLTKPDVPEEISRISALRPVFSSCLAGIEKVKLNQITMRGTIAINYYRLANATRRPEALH